MSYEKGSTPARRFGASLSTNTIGLAGVDVTYAQDKRIGVVVWRVGGLVGGWAYKKKKKKAQEHAEANRGV